MPMKAFELSRFLSEQELTPAMLARHLRVSVAYLGAVLAGEEALGERDRVACLTLAARLARERRALRAVQIELPFGEAPVTFTREYNRQRAQERAVIPERPSPRTRSPNRPTRTPTVRRNSLGQVSSSSEPADRGGAEVTALGGKGGRGRASRG
jgi:hypothetical protein